MFEISNETLRLIKRAYRGKEHLKLTVGYLRDNHSVIKIFNENGELHSPEKYQYEIDL